MFRSETGYAEARPVALGASDETDLWNENHRSSHLRRNPHGFRGDIGFFFFVFFLFQTLRLADFLIVHQLPAAIVGKIGFCMLISFSPFVFPVSFLAAMLVSFERLSADSELTAMKACGLSMHRLIRPAFFAGVLVTVLSILTFFEVAPWAERTLSREINNAGNQRALSALQSGTFVKGFFGLTMYTEASDPISGELKNVVIYDSREEQNPLLITAPRGRMDIVSAPNHLWTRRLLSLYKGRALNQGEKPGSSTNSLFYFDKYQIYLEDTTHDSGDPTTPRSFATRKLLDMAKNEPPQSRAKLDAETEIWKRIHISISPLIFVFLGAGLGTVRQRMGTGYPAIATLLVALVYWQTLMVGVTWGSTGQLAPWIAMAAPSLLISMIGFFAFRKTLW